MGNGDDGCCIFSLTSLQIGDLQSYLSDLSFFLALESKKFYILVDNRPWLRDLGSHPAHLWQLMVTKSRLSPFANTKARKKSRKGKEACPKPSTGQPHKHARWFSFIDAATLSRKRVLLPVKKLRNSLLLSSELHRTLYGFIVFEVAWSNVRGINYLNELQTDTSLAIEAKFIQRWEFDSIAQAASSLTSWFSGTTSEQLQLREYMDFAIGEVFYDAEEDISVTPISGVENISDYNPYVEDDSLRFLSTKFTINSATDENDPGEPHTPPPPTGPYKRRKVMKSSGTGVEVDTYSEEIGNTETCCSRGCENRVEATQYRDVLLLFRFNDHDLPFKLRDIIMSDLRLLTLLEAGLPSWVIFLQSYPGFCHLYRSWMCPLARALYVIISFVTVLIGFYDLYKNVPVLKATASRLCGPLLDWIETWEMVSRIKYLGTMLFLHNFQKAVNWFLTIRSTTGSFFSVLTQPLAEPLLEFFGFLLPAWNGLIKVVEGLLSIIWIIIGSSCGFIENLVEILLLPLWFLLSVVWHMAISILYPVFWILWEILYAPIRMVLALSNLVAFVYTCLYEMIGEIWEFISYISRASETTVKTYEASMWRSLWNDLFSQVFRAVKSILYGFVAFFAACNRHRLSIYNHVQKFMQRLFCRTPQSWHNDQTPRVRHEDPRHRRSKYDTHNLVRTRLYEFSYSGSRTIMQYKIVVAVLPCEHNLFVSSNLFGQSSNYYYHNF